MTGLSPFFQCSASRVAPWLSQQDLHPQCFTVTGNASYHLRPQSRTTASLVLSRPQSTSNPSPIYQFRIGAAYSAKGRRFDPKSDLFAYNPSRRIATGKESVTGRPSSGQDAFFVSKIGNGSNVAFGVADGVGGWADSGIDSAQFSHGLCEQIIEAARSTTSEMEGKLRARELLQKGYNGVVADQTIPGGGSTACVAIGRNDGYLEVAK